MLYESRPTKKYILTASKFLRTMKDCTENLVQHWQRKHCATWFFILKSLHLQHAPPINKHHCTSQSSNQTPNSAIAFLSDCTHTAQEGLCLAITSSHFRTALRPYGEKLLTPISPSLMVSPALPVQQGWYRKLTAFCSLSHTYTIQAS